MSPCYLEPVSSLECCGTEGTIVFSGSSSLAEGGQGGKGNIGQSLSRSEPARSDFCV